MRGAEVEDAVEGGVEGGEDGEGACVEYYAAVGERAVRSF